MAMYATSVTDSTEVSNSTSPFRASSNNPAIARPEQSPSITRQLIRQSAVVGVLLVYGTHKY